MTEESKSDKPFDRTPPYIHSYTCEKASGHSEEFHAEKTLKKFPHAGGRPRLGSDRIKTNVFISKAIQEAFIEACKVTGHNTCSVDESLKKAFVDSIARASLGGVDVCPWRSISISIDTLNITPKYDMRGPKPRGRTGFIREKEIAWAQRLSENSLAPYNVVAIADKVHYDLECDPSLREEPFYDLLIAVLQKKGLEV